MSPEEMQTKFEAFFTKQYNPQIIAAARESKPLVVDFADLEKFDTLLADILLDSPISVFKEVDNALSNIDTGMEQKRLVVRFKNLPERDIIEIKNLRSKHIKKLIAIKGIIKQASEVRPKITAATFECKSCGERIVLLQENESIETPYVCTCGNRRSFDLIMRKLIDHQRIIIEECPENLVGSAQPRKLPVYLRDDLVDPNFQKKIVPGNKIVITGILNDSPILTALKQESVKRDIYLDANHIDTIDQEFEEIILTEKDIEDIKEFVKNPKLYELLIKAMAPSIYGYEDVKEAVALQLFGGVRKVRHDGVTTRGDIHILLVGDPGAGKSQLLKYVMGLAPKARYIVGKSASGAGITATVVKDEFMRGWALEAGAIVLANNGIIGIDELDKMTPEDRSAMHEAMEQQCYHPETEIIFANGRIEKIGPFVEKLMNENRQKIYKGKDCEILPVEGIQIQTTDMKRISTTSINRVSRHKAPKKMYKITYSNGRSICVTPEHPTFVWSGDKIIEMRADKMSEGMLAPAPLFYKTRPKTEIALQEPERWHPNLKEMSFPKVLDKNLARFLGYFVSEGHSYKNEKNRYAEVGITNTNCMIIEEINSLWGGIFNVIPNILTQNSPLRHNNVPVQISRCPSQFMYDFLLMNFPELAVYSTSRAIPQKIRESAAEIQCEFLKTMFLGDGFVDSERFGYITSSHELAKGTQDILLNNGIWSYIATDVREKGTYYKAVISKESMQKFNEIIVSANDKRAAKIDALIKRSASRLNSTDIVPAQIVQKLYAILAEYRLLDGYFNKIIENKQNSNRAVVRKYIETLEKRMELMNSAINSINSGNPEETRKLFVISLENIAKKIGICPSTIYNIEKNKKHAHCNLLSSAVKKMAQEKYVKTQTELQKIKDSVFSDIRFVGVKSVETIENHGLEWVYDVTVEPSRTFLSEGLVLHNTVTVSKANVQATLSAKTTVLAAANPKLGRFNNFNPLASQIDLPETLLSRFDLIFAFRDIPNKEKDTVLVRHILKLHREPDVQNSPIETEFLRKYIAHAKSTCFPVLTRAAEAVIENFYVGLRNKYAGETKENTAVPIGARQLEAIIRLAEASAKVRLSDKVLEEDAQRAVNVVTAYLMKLGVDPETGKLDIDRLESGISANQRNKIRIILDLIDSMQRDSEDKTVLIEDVLAAAEEQGIKDAMEIIQKMKREGELFEPKMGRIRKV